MTHQEMHPRALTSSWGSMTSTILENIFHLVCSSPSREDRARIVHNAALPLVCWRWSVVYRNSRLLWRDIDLDWRYKPSEFVDASLVPVEALERFEAVTRFLARRAALISSLRLSGLSDIFQAPGTPNQLEIVFHKACNSLESLSLIDLERCIDTIIPKLQGLLALQHLTLRWREPVSGSQAGLRVDACALAGISTLTALRSLDLSIDQLGGWVAQLSALSTLTALSRFRLVGRMESIVLPPDFISVMRSLCSLELENCRLPQFSPVMVCSLARVSYLSLSGVLAAKPRRKSGFFLWHVLDVLRGLKELVVCGAPKDATVLAAALACPRLRRLTLSECADLGALPGPFARVGGMQGGVYRRSSLDDVIDACPAVTSLEHLALVDVGLAQQLPELFWASLSKLSSLQWRAVRRAVSVHRLWDRGLLLEFFNQQGIGCLMPLLKELRVEYTGLDHSTVGGIAEIVEHAHKLEVLSLEGHLLGGAVDVILEPLTKTDCCWSLRKLSLRNCAMCAVPKAIPAFKRLEELDVENNPGFEVWMEEETALLSGIEIVRRNDIQTMTQAGQSEDATAAPAN